MGRLASRVSLHAIFHCFVHIVISPVLFDPQPGKPRVDLGEFHLQKVDRVDPVDCCGDNKLLRLPFRLMFSMFIRFPMGSINFKQLPLHSIISLGRILSGMDYLKSSR